MTKENDLMVVDLTDGVDPQTPSPTGRSQVDVPVAAGESGYGLPYAPQDWPNPGDTWRWKVGVRKRSIGHWADRYLFPPDHFPNVGIKHFASKLSVRKYIEKEFPGSDVDAFFASFSWKIPYVAEVLPKGSENSSHNDIYEKSFDNKNNLKSVPVVDCKVGNKACSLQSKSMTNVFMKDCRICCSEPSFCRNCSCILCSKPIDWAYGGYSFIKCEAAVGGNYICGHVAHIDCALRCYMAGTVGGSINLDVEYYCRRCDSRTGLIAHVEKILSICRSLDPYDNVVEKILRLGLFILNGSEKEEAKKLRAHIEAIVSKLNCGPNLFDFWKVDDNPSTFGSSDVSLTASEITILGIVDTEETDRNVALTSGHETSQGIADVDGRALNSVFITSDHENASEKLENEIDCVLKELKSSQEREYAIAEQKLHAQKDHLLGLYQMLDADRSELASCGDGSLLSNIMIRIDKIKHEQEKLDEMMKVSKGFGRTPKSTICKHFGLSVDD